MVAIKKKILSVSVASLQTRNRSEPGTPRTPAPAAPRVRVVPPAQPAQRQPTQAAPTAQPPPATPTTEQRQPAAPAAAPGVLSDADVDRIASRLSGILGRQPQDHDNPPADPQPRAPAMHFDDGVMGPRRTIRDLELMALDNGMRADDVDRWRAGRQGDLPVVPAGHRFKSSTRGRRQFSHMRGGRRFGLNMTPEAGLGSAAGAPDDEVGALWCAYAAYMATAGRVTGRIDSTAVNLAYKVAKRDGQDPILIRALGESVLADGGVLVPEIVLESYIELLYANTIYLQGNPLRVQVARGKVSMPRLASGAIGGWVGESQNITADQESFDDVSLNLRKLALVVPWSNDLASHAIASIEALVREDMTLGNSVLVDTAMIRGTGTVYQPRGLKSEAHADTTFNANATVNAANVTVDTTKMMRLQMDKNIKGTKWFWLFAPRSLMYLWGARDSQNQLIWRDELLRGTFNGRPYGVTTTIPINLGGGTDESEVYLVDYAHELYGEGTATSSRSSAAPRTTTARPWSRASRRTRPSRSSFRSATACRA
jgi:HK97 family phage major capsid protein